MSVMRLQRQAAVPASWLVALLAAATLGWVLAKPWMVIALTAIALLIIEAVSQISRPRATAYEAAGVPAYTSPVRRDSRTRLLVRRLAHDLDILRDAAAALPDAVVLLDKAGDTRWFNRAAESLLGLRQPDDLGVFLANRLDSVSIQGWLHADAITPLHDVPAPGDPRRRLSFVLIPLASGQRVLLGRDISALTRLENVRRDFVANVSHELRTPLTVIHGYLELMEPDEVPEFAPAIREMRTQSQRMSRIVEDLLTLSRLEVQEQVLEERVAMRLLLATLHREAIALSRGRHQITLLDDCDLDLQGSLKDLHSAFSNLVSNAVRYTPSEGRIEIHWQAEPTGGARFSVTDNGYGIPASHLSRLTERFYRVSSSRSRETGGTGLGLSIVKHSLALHQAQLEVTSQPGKGSTFACVFGADRVLAPEAGIVQGEGNKHD